MDKFIFLIFNGIGFLLSLGAIVLIVYTVSWINNEIRRGFLLLLKSLGIISLSFLWAFLFGVLVVPSEVLSVQAVILSFGMAMMIYSANKLIELHDLYKNK